MPWEGVAESRREPGVLLRCLFQPTVCLDYNSDRMFRHIPLAIVLFGPDRGNLADILRLYQVDLSRLSYLCVLK